MCHARAPALMLLEAVLDEEIHGSYDRWFMQINPV